MTSKTDWKKADSLTEEEMLADPYAPEITAEQFATAVRRGRGPQKQPTKKLVSLCLDQDVIDHFRSQGRGWQTRVNDVLRKKAHLN
jgi:uncharacterized protein (DUF4415 family)